MKLKSLKSWVTKDGKRRVIRRYGAWNNAKYKAGCTQSFEEFCKTWTYRSIPGRKRPKVSTKTWVTRTGKDRQIRLFGVWIKMRKRCSDRATNDHRKYYYDKGIRVCQEWDQDFHVFREWAVATGYGKNLTIDRIDSDKGYCPENCEWITQSENTRRMNEKRRAAA